MAKRFIDTSIFRKPLIRSMEAPYKALFIYLLCECDHAGVWDVELGVASDRMGMPITVDALDKMGGAVVELDKGSKWYLVNFVEFQYGVLNRSNRVHLSVIDRLAKLGIDPTLPTVDLAAPRKDGNKGLIRPLQGSKDKDKDKDKEKRERVKGEPVMLFSASTVSDPEVARSHSGLAKAVASNVDLAHYAEAIRNWSEINSVARTESGWVATYRQFILRDHQTGTVVFAKPLSGQNTIAGLPVTPGAWNRPGEKPLSVHADAVSTPQTGSSATLVEKAPEIEEKEGS